MNQKIALLINNLKGVIRGKDEVIELLTACLLAGGNILMEDVPGVGKTTLAKALAFSIDGNFSRIQFTPDLLPADILGCSIYNPKTGEFHFRRGPVFTNILLADEINRASPRTQSALLEAMSEEQATIEGHTYRLEAPFLVIATENPIEFFGTYPLPEAQLDRFSMRLNLGYPSEEEECSMMLDRREHDPLTQIRTVISKADIIEMQKHVKTLHIDKSLSMYMTRIVRATRSEPGVKLGASPRALLSLSKCAQALAFIRGRTYVIPDDIKLLAPKILAHRLILDSKSKFSGISQESVINSICSRMDVPV